MQNNVSSSLGRICGPGFPQARMPLYEPTVGILRAVSAWLHPAMCRLQAKAQVKRDRAALLAMPDHMLRDIGVSRCEILSPLTRQPFLGSDAS